MLQRLFPLRLPLIVVFVVAITALVFGRGLISPASRMPEKDPLEVAHDYWKLEIYGYFGDIKQYMASSLYESLQKKYGDWYFRNQDDAPPLNVPVPYYVDLLDEMRSWYVVPLSDSAAVVVMRAPTFYGMLFMVIEDGEWKVALHLRDFWDFHSVHR